MALFRIILNRVTPTLMALFRIFLCLNICNIEFYQMVKWFKCAVPNYNHVLASGIPQQVCRSGLIQNWTV